VGKILLCCFVLIAALLAGKMFIHPLEGALVLRISGTLALITLGAAAYFLAAKLMKLPDASLLFRPKKP
jgi:hypothetical protein